MDNRSAYVIIEWVDITPAYPRYSFATTVHAAELGDAIRWVQPCTTAAVAASLVARLNARVVDVGEV